VKKKIVVKKTEAGRFELRTVWGGPIGVRLLSHDPAKGKEFPPLETSYPIELDAMRAALAWNVYFGEKSCRKTTKRSN